MADSFNRKTAQDDDNEDEDYMGDLSQFIPPVTSQPLKAQFKKVVLSLNLNSPLYGSQENVFNLQIYSDQTHVSCRLIVFFSFVAVIEQQRRSFSIIKEAIKNPKLARTEESCERAAATRRGLTDPSEYGGSDSPIEHRVQNVETNGLYTRFGTGEGGLGPSGASESRYKANASRDWKGGSRKGEDEEGRSYDFE